MQRLSSSAKPAAPAALQDTGEVVQFLVFRLGTEEFGLPIRMVDEVARVPEQVTRIPRTPEFLEGVINLRGDVLPVIDQRKRFSMAEFDGHGRRLIVVRSERHRAGLIVDSVSEVLRCSADSIEPAPDLAEEASGRLIDSVINLPEAQRMILLLDPSELLSGAERGLLDAFAAQSAEPLAL